MPRTPLPEIPYRGDERATLVGFLEFYRAALLDRAFDLAEPELRTALPPSNLTLARIIGHMAVVEGSWFRERLAGEPAIEPFASLDWGADIDAEMTLAQTWSREELLLHFDTAVADSRRRVDAASSLDQLSVASHPSGGQWSLRWIMVHMIEEYARHCGHADLIRQSIDGEVA